MMSSMLHLVKAETEYSSTNWFEAETSSGVRYALARMSFGRRLELARLIREIARRAEFLEAGQDPREKLEAAVVNSEVDLAYLDWGLLKIEGLTIDGAAATPESVIARGPVALTKEILERIKAESGLSENERKN